MQFKKINLKNFKCFSNAQLELGKITLLTGANSSGKSSILYSILSAAQTSGYPFMLSPNGQYVNMGDFREFTKDHNPDNWIGVGFDLINDSGTEINLQTLWIENDITRQPKLNELKISSKDLDLVITKRRKFTIQIKLKTKPLKATQFFNLIMETLRDNDVSNDNLNDPVINQQRQDFLNNFPKWLEGKKRNLKFTSYSVSRKVILEEISKNGTATMFSLFNDLINDFKRINNDLNFISSFRLYPERTYYEKTKDNYRVGKFGENYEDQIIAWESTNSDEFRKLKKILKNLDLLDDIRARRLEGGRFEVQVKITKKGALSSLNDVGFGISQLLPVLIADLQLPENSTLLVAQPEIHLHPKVQASYGDFVISQVLEENKNYIIETHSEYLLNRLRLNVTTGKIKSEDIKCYYLENSGKNVELYKLEFKKNGEITGAPDSFFDTYMMDVMNIAINS